MNELTNTTAVPLVYSGVEIRNRGEMISLTDMWKATAGDESQRPYEWSRKEGAAFIEAVSLSLNTPVERIYRATKGKGGATYAHWQIGLAYAKYLSPNFHMWCNSVVRDKMEGKQPVTNLPSDLTELLERDHGILRMLSHKVTNIEKALPGIIKDYLASALEAKVAEHAMLFRHGVTAKQIWDDFQLPPKLRGSTVWLGNRLSEMGCLLEWELRAQRGVTAVRLFDPDRSRVCMNNGLLLSARVYSAEKQGQGRLRLVPADGGAA